MKALIRFALIWALARALAPYLNRLFEALIARTPPRSFANDVLTSLRNEQSTTLMRSLGETAGDLVFGPKTKGRG